MCYSIDCLFFLCSGLFHRSLCAAYLVLECARQEGVRRLEQTCSGLCCRRRVHDLIMRAQNRFITELVASMLVSTEAKLDFKRDGSGR
jgi:hypothetical protein